jgi:hypothetical protein
MKWLDRNMVHGPHLFLATSEASFKRAMRGLGVAREKWPTWQGDDAIARVHSFMHKNGSLACVVSFRPPQVFDGIDVACTLVHEAVHVFQQWCAHYEERAPSREFEAYSIDGIAERLMRIWVEEERKAYRDRMKRELAKAEG